MIDRHIDDLLCRRITVYAPLVSIQRNLYLVVPVRLLFKDYLNCIQIVNVLQVNHQPLRHSRIGCAPAGTGIAVKGIPCRRTGRTCRRLHAGQIDLLQLLTDFRLRKFSVKLHLPDACPCSAGCGFHRQPDISGLRLLIDRHIDDLLCRRITVYVPLISIHRDFHFVVPVGFLLKEHIDSIQIVNIFQVDHQPLRYSLIGSAPTGIRIAVKSIPCRRTGGTCRRLHAGQIDLLDTLIYLRTMDAHGAELMLQIRSGRHQLAGHNICLRDLSHVHPAGIEAVIVIHNVKRAVAFDHIRIADTGTCIQQQRMGPGPAAIVGQECGQVVSAVEVLMVDHQQIAAAGPTHINCGVGMGNIRNRCIGPGNTTVIGEALLHVTGQLTQQHPQIAVSVGIPAFRQDRIVIGASGNFCLTLEGPGLTSVGRGVNLGVISINPVKGSCQPFLVRQSSVQNGDLTVAATFKQTGRCCPLPFIHGCPGILADRSPGTHSAVKADSIANNRMLCPGNPQSAVIQCPELRLGDRCGNIRMDNRNGRIDPGLAVVIAVEQHCHVALTQFILATGEPCGPHTGTAVGSLCRSDNGTALPVSVRRIVSIQIIGRTVNLGVVDDICRNGHGRHYIVLFLAERIEVDQIVLTEVDSFTDFHFLLIQLLCVAQTLSGQTLVVSEKSVGHGCIASRN